MCWKRMGLDLPCSLSQILLLVEVTRLLKSGDCSSSEQGWVTHVVVLQSGRAESSRPSAWLAEDVSCRTLV